MTTGASRFPFSQLLHRLIEHSGHSHFGFVQALGYRRLNRGVRRLEEWLDRGDGDQEILKLIIAIFPGHADELDTAVAATKAIKTAEDGAAFLRRCNAEWDSFIPYVHVDGERTVPSGITLFGISGGEWNLIKISPVILESRLDQQLKALSLLMRAYLKRHEGQCPFFGAVTGFKFVRLIDHFQFDREGSFVAQVAKPFRRGTCSVELR